MAPFIPRKIKFAVLLRAGFRLLCNPFRRLCDPILIIKARRRYRKLSGGLAVRLARLNIGHENAATIIMENHGELSENILQEADRILEHRFCLLGFKDIKIEPLRWKGFSSMGIDDIKFPWELNRLYHLITLGKAYALNSNPKYYREFETQIYAWWQSNPPFLGVNWKSGMEASIRLFNVIIASWFFRKELSDRSEFVLVLEKLVVTHLNFVESHLEVNRLGYTNNHTVACLAGLLLGEILYRDTQTGSKWLDKTLDALSQCLWEQVDEHGVQYENSTYYHCFVLEILLYCYAISSKNGLEMPPVWNQKLPKMLFFLSEMQTVKDRIPQIGDSDNGNLIRLGRYFKDDYYRFNHLLAMGQVLFSPENFKMTLDPQQCEEAVWLWGNLKPPDLHPLTPPTLRYRNGYTIFKGPQTFALLNGNPPGYRTMGGHKHNDLLSITYSYSGKEFLVDSGTYCYSGDKQARLKFRGTAAHNTIMIDGREQNGIYTSPLFAMNIQAECQLVEMSEGEHIMRAGLKLKYGRDILHQRTVSFSRDDETLCMIDEIQGTGTHLLESRLHLYPDVKILNAGEGAEPLGQANFIKDLDSSGLDALTKKVLKLENDGILLTITLFYDKDQQDFSVSNSLYSEDYGVVLDNQVLIIKGATKLPARLGLLIRPGGYDTDG
ncbi:alginate lyase family protein [bacterium]|nr:alginate lyase family protein [bacterium]